MGTNKMDSTKSAFNTETAMKFGEAIEHLKDGKSISRNGGEVKLSLTKGSDPTSFDKTELWLGIRGDLFNLGDEGTVTRTPHIEAFANGINRGPFAFNHEDILAEDWAVIY